MQGLPPEADYRFKHALILDVAYENLLKSRRQILHRRVAGALRDNITASATPEPELLAHHFKQAGMPEAAIEWWGKAGQRSLDRSALVEAIAQLTRALDEIATLPPTPALRREQINLQVALITPLVHVKGYAASETRAAVERAHVLIEQAQALGEPPDDPLLLFSVLYGFWAVNTNGDVARNLATQFLTLAEKQRMKAVQPHAHHFMGVSLLETGDIAGTRAHFDQAIALYDPAHHRLLATRFGQDARVSAFSRRSPALWFLGYPDAALADALRALSDARELGQAAALMMALWFASWTLTFCGNYVAANAQVDELIALADEKGSGFWNAVGMVNRGWLFAETGRPADAVQMNTSGLAAVQSTGATMSVPIILINLAKVHAELGHFDEAWRCIGEAQTAVQATKVALFEAELNRVAGDTVLRSPVPDLSKAQAYFERALAVARQQQAKSWELRAAMSMARLWRDQGKRDEARELLAPVYGWFTEGFDTLDLKEAKVLLELSRMSRVSEWLEKIGLADMPTLFMRTISTSTTPTSRSPDFEGHWRILRGIGGESAAIGELNPPVPCQVRTRRGSKRKARVRRTSPSHGDVLGPCRFYGAFGAMGPEDLREVISAYQTCVAETVNHFGGFVAKYMGDGVLVYFGYPQAPVDDAERAVRSGVGVDRKRLAH